MHRPVAGAVGAAALAALVQLGPAVTGIPAVTRRILPSHCGSGRPGHVDLTFDDGPHPEGTPAVLRILAEKGCRATFFVIGEQAVQHPDLIRRVHGEGHEIGVHGWTHTAVPWVAPHRIRRELRDTADLVTDLTGRSPRWYRPPYGAASGPALAAAAATGLSPVWWTGWVRDWSRTASAQRISERALARPTDIARTGATLLLHDSDAYGRPESWRLVAAALPTILDSVHRRGFRTGPLSARPTRREGRGHGFTSP